MVGYERIRMVLSDLDETLLSPAHRVGERSRAAIAALQKRGIIVAVCTGRAPEATSAIVQSLGLRYYICNNGASVHDGTQVLAARTIPPDVTAALAQFFEARSIPVYLMTPQGYFLTRHSPGTDAADRARGVSPALLKAGNWELPAHKVMAWDGAKAYAECREAFADAVHIIYHPDYLEIAPKGVSKQWGGAHLAKHLGVAPGAVAAVGDALNDLELIEWAGIGAAMGNAMDALKAAADLVLPSHDADGTADLLEAILAAVRPA